MEKISGPFPFLYKIILIDDDVEDQELFSSALQDFDHQLIKFSSGKAALNYLQPLPRPQHPLVIITDYQMPEMSGVDLLYALKNNLQLYHIPVIIYSSAMNNLLQERLKRFGAAGCFAKSEHLDELKNFLKVLGVIFENSIFHVRE